MARAIVVQIVEIVWDVVRKDYNCMKFWKRKTPEEKQIQKVKKAIRSIASANEWSDDFYRFNCEGFFVGYEKCAQNTVKWRQMEDKIDKNVKLACQVIDKLKNNDISLPIVVNDFWERRKSCLLD